MAAGNYWMALMNLDISPWQVIWPRVVLIVGLSMIFAPLNVAAFKYTPTHLRGAAVGLFALLRNEGGSVGTSMAQTIQERREQFHLARVGEFLDPLNPHVQLLPRAGPGVLPPADRRPGRGRSRWPCRRWPTCASSRRRRWPTSTSSGCSPSWPGARAPGAADEALGGREGGAHRGGVGKRAVGVNRRTSLPESSNSR